MGPVGDAPQIDPRHAERAAQVLQIVGALLGVVAADRDARGAPAGDAVAEGFGMIGRERRLAQHLGRIEAPPGGAGRDVVGEADAALVECDHVGDLAEREEDGLRAPAPGRRRIRRARRRGRRSARPCSDWSSGKRTKPISIRRERRSCGLRDAERAALRGEIAAVGEAEGRRARSAIAAPGWRQAAGAKASAQSIRRTDLRIMATDLPWLAAGSVACGRRAVDPASANADGLGERQRQAAGRRL